MTSSPPPLPPIRVSPNKREAMRITYELAKHIRSYTSNLPDGMQNGIVNDCVVDLRRLVRGDMATLDHYVKVIT